MYKNLLLFIFSIFFSYNSMAQSQPASIETWISNTSGETELSKKTTFKYDMWGNDTLISVRSWDKESQSFLPFESKIIRKTYDESCLVSQHETNNYDGFFITFQRNDYYVDLSCRIDSIDHYTSDQFGGLYHATMERFSYNGNEETGIYYLRDQEGYFTDASSKKVISKDNDGNIILESVFVPHYSIPDSFTLHRQTDYEYRFNDQNQIQHSLAYTISYDPFNNFSNSISNDYEYYCDGLLKKQTSFYSNGFISIQLYQYQNLVGEDCNLSEKEDLISIRPNLTYDQVFIESEILQSSTSQIAVYDMSGKRVGRFALSERIHNYTLDLGFLPPGHYIIHVLSNEYSATERIVKM